MKEDKTKRVEKVYGQGEATFELQLAAFIRAVRGEDTPPINDAVANMEIIDEIYEKSGLGKRPSHRSG